jgi:hypothetical protein
MGAKKNACRILVEKPEIMTPLGSPRCWWVNNIKMDLRKLHREVWTGLIWLRTGRNEGFLSTLQQTFGSHKMLQNS